MSAPHDPQDDHDPTAAEPADVDAPVEYRGAFGEFGGDAGGALIERTFRERIVIVGVALPGVDEDEVERSLDELTELVDTAGADVVDRLVQRRSAPEPARTAGWPLAPFLSTRRKAAGGS